jgi:hypothetical protein
MDTTTQVILPTPYCLFENLYFKTDTSTFFAYGDTVAPDKAIVPDSKRGYAFKMMPPKMDPKQILKNIKTIEGTTLFLFESIYTQPYLNHFFHLLEHLVGIWSFYGAEHFNEVNLIILASDGTSRSPVNWQGPNLINKHLLKALFPNAEVKPWRAFTAQNQHQILQMERAITSDRARTFQSQICQDTNKMIAEALPSLSAEALNQLALQVNAYAKTPPRILGGTVVTYVKRTPPRALDPNIEDKLLKAIRQLPGVTLNVVDFAKISFYEQINIVGNTDVLIGVHGNGLSHILFLPQTAGAIEIFPSDAYTLDYRMFADARGIDYLGISSNRGVIDRDEAYAIGISGNLNSMVNELDFEPILEWIRSR